MEVSEETLRRWLLAEGLWHRQRRREQHRQRRREQHRQRRPRRKCFGELVQMDTSIHDWTEGRGESMVLVTMIDDATSKQWARFYASDDMESHMDLLGRWLMKYGRPVSLYTDRHSIFQAQKRGVVDEEGETQFGRALKDLGIDLIRANSPQAKGRVERSFGTAQDRWVKEMRLAKVKTIAEANALLEKLLPEHNRKFGVSASDPTDAHRPLDKAHHLGSILSLQHIRVAGNDYTIRFRNRVYQLGKPAYPGLRNGRVVIELRLDATMAMRFEEHYLKYEEIETGSKSNPRANPKASDAGSKEPRAGLADLGSEREDEFGEGAGGEEGDGSGKGKDRGSVGDSRSPGVKPTVGRSGRTPAEYYPPEGEEEDSKAGPRRPATDHPWRKGFKSKK